MASDIEKAPEALQELVAKSDTGARKPVGATGTVIFATALAWALFQTWYASPLPFALGFGILNDTEARSVHLAFALFLAFTAWPAFKSSPRDRVPWQDWLFALAGAFAAAYIILFYRELATRPRRPACCCCSRRRVAPSAGRWPRWRRCSSPTAWGARGCPRCCRTRARPSTA